MFVKVLLNVIVVFAITSTCTGIKRYLPTVNGSYRAIGEIITRETDLGIGEIVMAFEENFDTGAHMTSFWLSLLGMNTTILENTVVGNIQSFQYNPAEGTCTQVNISEWDKSGITAGLRPIHNAKGTVIFPIRELLNLKVTDLAENGWSLDTVTYRGQLANKFDLRLEQDGGALEITAYWGASEGGTSITTQKEIPLGFVITRITSPRERPVVHDINIFYFAIGEVNQNALQPIRGIFCPGRKDPDPFPKLEKYQNWAWSAEFTWAERGITTGIDAWMDMKNHILRVDFETLETLSGVDSPAESLIVSFDEQTVYHINHEGKRQCRVTHLDNEPYYPQIIIDPRLQGNWDPDVFFGVKNHKFVRIGQTIERGVPCGIYQATRNDWPFSEEKVTTVWEWCIANNLLPDVQFSDNQLPLISLNIYVTDSPYEEGENKQLQKGQRLSYHFYNVREVEPYRMETLAFDISPCFTGSRKVTVSFLVDVKPSEREFLMEIDNDAKLNSNWQQAAYVATKLSPHSLRITRVKSSFQDMESPLRVQLTILDQHPDSVHRVQDLGIDAVKKSLKEKVDSGALGIQYLNEKKAISLDAKPGSFLEEDGEGNDIAAFPPALFRAQERIAQHEADQMAARRNEMLPWLLGAVCLQIGVAVGIISVVLKRRRTLQDETQLVQQSSIE